MCEAHCSNKVGQVGQPPGHRHCPWKACVPQALSTAGRGQGQSNPKGTKGLGTRLRCACWGQGMGCGQGPGCVVGVRDGAASNRDVQGPGPRGRSRTAAMDGKGHAALTHLAEAAEAGQHRFAERKASHCGREKRGGVSLGQAATTDRCTGASGLCVVGPGGLDFSGPDGPRPPTPAPADSLGFRGGSQTQRVR